MNLDSYQKKIIDRWLSAVETGDPDGDYSNVTVYYDGRGGKRQITYGKHQTTEAGRNVQKVVSLYINALAASGGIVPSILSKFVTAATYSMSGSTTLIKELKKIGEEKIMQDIQERFFFTNYMSKANGWAKDHGFEKALSMLVIYDSFIHSGGVPLKLRKQFPEMTPVDGGREEDWIERYTLTRQQWLKYNQKKILNKTIYRTKGLLDLIDKGDWDLHSKPIKVNGITVTTKESPPEKYEGTIVCPTCLGKGRIQNDL